MPLADLVGQDAVTAALRRAVDTGQIAHAYLFVGPEAVGKHTAALALAQALNCRQPRQGDACGRCASCRKVELGVHPDVRVIGPTLRDLTPVPDDAPGVVVPEREVVGRLGTFVGDAPDVREVGLAHLEPPKWPRSAA